MFPRKKNCLCFITNDGSSVANYWLNKTFSKKEKHYESSGIRCVRLCAVHKMQFALFNIIYSNISSPIFATVAIALTSITAKHKKKEGKTKRRTLNLKFFHGNFSFFNEKCRRFKTMVGKK